MSKRKPVRYCVQCDAPIYNFHDHLCADCLQEIYDISEEELMLKLNAAGSSHSKYRRRRKQNMITIEKTRVSGIEEAIRGMRNPMNSWKQSDSDWEFVEDPAIINPDDQIKFILGDKDNDCRLG